MRQPKKVQRKKEVITENSVTQFNIYINLSGLQNADKDNGLNPNVYFSEETITTQTTETKVFDEVITMRQYLEEQKQLVQPAVEGDFIEPADVQMELADDPDAKQGEQQSAEEGNALSITYKNTDILTQLVISPMQRASMMEEVVKNFKIIIPKVVAKPVEFIPS